MENEQFERIMSSIKERIRNEKEKLLEEENQLKIKKYTFSLGEGQKQREYFIKHQFCLTTQNFVLKWFIQLSIPGLQPLYFGIKKV